MSVQTGDPLRADIAVELAEQLIELGDFARADELLPSAERGPGGGGGRASGLNGSSLSRPSGAKTIERSSRDARVTWRAAIIGGGAKAHMLAFWVNGARTGRRAADQARQAAEHARHRRR